MANYKRIMGLDVGNARVGVALSDALGITSQPFTTVEYRTLKELLENLKTIIASNNIGQVVIGLPYLLDGRLGEQGKLVQSFYVKFSKFLKSFDEFKDIEVFLWDERLTTAQAKRVLAGSGLVNRDKSAALDRVSAAIILESFVSSRRV